MKKTLVSCSICMMCLASFAQTPILSSSNSSTSTMVSQSSNAIQPRYSFFELGYSSVTMDMDGSEEDDWKGYSASFVSGKKVSQTNPVYLEYGIGLDYLTYSEKNGYKVEYKFFTVDVPVKILYDIPIDNFHLRPFAGVGLKGHASGKLKVSYSGNSETLDLFDSKDTDELGLDDPFKRVQAYYTLGTYVQLNKVLFGISYNKDISEITDDTFFSGVNFKLGFSF